MHKEVLTSEQKELLPVIRGFSSRFVLVGGTAIALHLGHRRSIDFDLFSFKPFRNSFLLKDFTAKLPIDQVLVNNAGELTFFSKGVKITFFHYPYQLESTEKLENVITMPDILSLATMKAFALGRRAKWKDYVDLYFILKNGFTIEQIAERGGSIFGNEFNEKIFRTQLSYFIDIDYSEAVEFLPGFETSEEEIKKSLVEFSLQ